MTNLTMQIIPVLDLKGGQVVRGKGGRRNEYRPIVSNLASSSEPVEIALAFRTQLGLDCLYIADLDAIAGKAPNMAIFEQLQRLDFKLWIDAGLRYADDAPPLAEINVAGIVFGLESLLGPEQLGQACGRFGPRVVFSLDLKQGKPLGGREAWHHGDSWSVCRQAIAAGVRRMIVLDLARVGENTGIGTEALCAQIVQSYPGVEVIAGGGVRDVEDLRRLQSCGVAGVLLASVLHDGVLNRGRLAEFTGRG
jgi:phosphoribosylformimino-5-aminoimidazole carboxamide ribotide isomerase